MAAYVAAYAANGIIITAAQAQQAALKAAPGKVLKVELENEKHGLAYDVHTFGNSNISKIEVSAVNGNIVKMKQEHTGAHVAATLDKAAISHEQARENALKQLPGSKVKKSELKVKSGTAVYEVELIDPKGIEHDIYINAANGSVIAVKQDKTFINTPVITPAQAEKTALATISGEAFYTKLDEDKQRLYYETSILSANGIYKVKVDAVNGSVLQAKMK